MTRERAPELILERLAAGELSRNQESALRMELEKEPGGMARLEKIQTSNEEILAKYAPADMAERIRVKAAARQRVKAAAAEEKKKGFELSSFLRLAVPALTAVAVLAVFGGPMIKSRLNVQTEGPAAISDTGDRLKGEPKLFVFRRTADGEQAIFEGETAKAGETVQVAYQAGATKYGMIFSADGRGGLTLHFPYSLQGTSELVTGKKVFLKDAFTLDNSPRFERFFLVLSKKPLDAGIEFGRLSASARSNALTTEQVKSLFQDCQVLSLTLAKEDRK